MCGTVLIVDDEECLRLTYSEFLRMEGYDVRTAEDVPTALRLLATTSVDVVVTDIIMPGRTGVDLLRDLRSQSPDTAVIMVTGEPTVATAAQSVRLGAFDYLSKPVDRQELCRVVGAAARDKKLRDENRRLEGENEQYRKRLEGTVQAQNREIETAYEFMKELNLLISLEETYGVIARRTGERLGCRVVSLLAREEEGFVLRAAVGLDTGQVNLLRVADDHPFCRRVMGSAQAMILEEGEPLPAGMPASRPMLAVPLVSQQNVLGLLCAAERDPRRDFDQHDIRALGYMADAAAVAVHNQLHRRSLEQFTYQTIRAMISAVEARDEYTSGHSQRVVRNALAAGRRLGLPPDDVRALELGGILHDVGKIGIPDAILNKPGKLTEEEFDVIRSHPGIGARMVSHLSFLGKAMDVICYHHERYDGAGYPTGMRGEEIPLVARILAVADTFDAMTSTRSYRPALSVETALTEIQKQSGSQFDPRCVDVFLDLARAGDLVVWGDDLPEDIAVSLLTGTVG